ncbi:hypothetical protein COV93_02630 [Candidatus Woesearchaeota archaeon CG11_big_fil_rev_8_21_14_0_20_43_8]|nr:MAG: hypothetical protein COV93_02630 [Candidatus Woesearchaeota archaeon CG11_big_fil_rev_8_21_14_0_20_43_8]PIO06748.1 MAG: hypothetical protein COT47_02910 [Candidatus Woesearchaeota archaeon CG08_land_8_20_14_0_20_43_7]
MKTSLAAIRDYAWQKLNESRGFLLFGTVGALGTLINTGVLYVLTFYAGIHYLISSVLATETAIISNFVGNHILTFNERLTDKGVFRKFISFQLISTTTIIGTILILWALTTSLGIGHLIVWNFIAIFVMFIFNYGLNKKFTWNKG